MKAIRLSILLMLCLSAAGIMNAQNTYTQNPHCTGLKNPTNFTFTGGLANALWKGHTGTKNEQVSTCTSLGSTFNTTNQASDLANTTGGSGYTCYGSSSVNYNGQSDATKRFVIKGSGYDPETNNTLPYQPPADTSFHTSESTLSPVCA